MKATTATHNSTGKIHNVEIYNSFVYFVDDLRKISIQDFNEFFTINK